MDNELSSREKAALGWLLKGFSNKEIGQALGISSRTVQKHLQRIYRHLGVQTRAEAIVLAHKQQTKPMEWAPKTEARVSLYAIWRIECREGNGR